MRRTKGPTQQRKPVTAADGFAQVSRLGAGAASYSLEGFTESLSTTAL